MNCTGLDSAVLKVSNRNKSSFRIKKWMPCLLMFIAMASIVRYLWVDYNKPTGDLEWYLDQHRSEQITFLGFEKKNVSIIIDQFSKYESKLWVASILSGLMFSIAVFASNRNAGFKNINLTLIITFIMLLINKYFVVLDMHLWRQQLAFYIFIISINQVNLLFKVVLIPISIFFHEITLILYILFYFSDFITLKIKSVKFCKIALIMTKFIASFYAYKLGYFQASIVCFFFMVYLLFIDNERDAIKFSLFVILMTILSLIISNTTSDSIIGKASSERLVFLSVMSGLFLFFTATVSEKNQNSKFRGKKIFKLRENSLISSYKIYSKNFLLLYPKVAFLLFYSFYTIG